MAMFRRLGEALESTLTALDEKAADVAEASRGGAEAAAEAQAQRQEELRAEREALEARKQRTRERHAPPPPVVATRTALPSSPTPPASSPHAASSPPAASSAPPTSTPQTASPVPPSAALPVGSRTPSATSTPRSTPTPFVDPPVAASPVDGIHSVGCPIPEAWAGVFADWPDVELIVPALKEGTRRRAEIRGRDEAAVLAAQAAAAAAAGDDARRSQNADQSQRERRRLREEMSLLQQELDLLTKEKRAADEALRRTTLNVTQQDGLMEEERGRFVRQIASLQRLKEDTDRDWETALREKEAAAAAAQEQLSDVVGQLRGKDAIISELRRGASVAEEGAVQSGRQLRDALSRAETDLLEARNVLAAEQRHAEELAERLSRADAEARDMQRLLDSKEEDLQRTEAAMAMKEQVQRSVTAQLEEHRARSAHVIELKDQEVERLRQRLAADPSPAPAAPTRTVDAAAAAERERLRDDVARMTRELRAAEGELGRVDAAAQRERAEFTALVAHHTAAAEQAREAAQSAQEALENAQRERREEELRASDAVREKETCIRQLEVSLERERQDRGEGKAEQRCRALAEQLMHKQTTLETRESELEQLRLKLRQAQQRVRDVELLSSVPSSVTPRDMALADGSDVEALTLPYQVSHSRFFQNLSRRGAVGARVTTAANRVDEMSFVVARVLRKNAVLRVTCMVYVAMLHFWVFWFFMFSSASLPDGTAHLDTNST